MTTRQAALSLYRRSLKLALDWAVHRHLWRGQALYIRSLFEANKKVTDPRQQRLPHTTRMGIEDFACAKIRSWHLTPGEIPALKLFESEKTLAFLDIGPLSKGHALVIPKYHGAKLADIPDDQLSEILPTLKKLVTATGATDYNILQNNGTIAHQQVHHVHFHMIPKPNETEGLGISWPATSGDMEKLKALCEDIKAKM
ncbi:Hit family protein 1 [Trichoderma lentiforme]|uniref:Hit family protein 1 n=1 Tax=Trichoderma lentiforme TaxID=1567552 RepID=A0A9P4X5A6_9HYPO|nr:Hit family protein 1 [Trichoderma lentiforme]